MALTLNTDGGARGNPGPAAIGVVIKKDGLPLAAFSRYLGDGLTNNRAEYEALIAGLEKVRELDMAHESVEIRMDSELVVKQMRGEYKVKHADMKPLHAHVNELLEHFHDARFVHIRRAENKEADALVNEALDAAS